MQLLDEFDLEILALFNRYFSWLQINNLNDTLANYIIYFNNIEESNFGTVPLHLNNYILIQFINGGYYIYIELINEINKTYRSWSFIQDRFILVKQLKDYFYVVCINRYVKNR